MIETQQVPGRFLEPVNSETMDHLCIIVSQPCKSQYKVTPAGFHSSLRGLFAQSSSSKFKDYQSYSEVQTRPCKMELEELQNIVWRIF